MIKLTNILKEGVYDPGIFKAVFTAGGPGSGKSYTASTLFGMPEKMPYVSAKGLKGVNSDSAFENYLDKHREIFNDNVNHPAHYTEGGIECIEAIEAQLTPEEYKGYLKGNVAKYLWREKHKGGNESLRKAQWYLNRLVDLQ